MSIVPASQLSRSELCLLGNNIAPAMRKGRRHRQLRAVNRSLAVCREQVSRLYGRWHEEQEGARTAVLQ